MPSPSVIEVEALLRPITPEAPTGANMQAEDSPSPLFVRLRTLRKAASDVERAAEADPASQTSTTVPPEWKELRELALMVLVEHSKDITVATWLLEALVRQEGFAGLRDGLQLLRRLVETHWDKLWPLQDEEGMRLKSIVDLNGATRPGTLLAPIARIPITEGGAAAHALWHFKRASTPRQAPADGSEAAAPEGPTLDELRQALDRSSDAFVTTLVDDVTQCLKEFDGLCEALRSRAGPEGPPPSSRIRNSIQEVLDTVQAHAGSRTGVKGGPSDGGTGGGSSTGGGGGAGGTGTGPVGSREAAFASLSRAAEYFRRTEPHSPLSYLLEQAVRWGRLPLPSLLEELIPDENARTQYRKLTGIPDMKPAKAEE